MGFGGLEKSARAQPRTRYTWFAFWMQIKLPLPPACYTTSTGAVRGSWCLQVHVASAFPRGIKRNVDESRGATVASCLSSHRRSSIVLHFFSGLGGCESLPLGCSWCFESLGMFLGRFLPFFLVLPTPLLLLIVGPGFG